MSSFTNFSIFYESSYNTLTTNKKEISVAEIISSWFNKNLLVSVLKKGSTASQKKKV